VTTTATTAGHRTRDVKFPSCFRAPTNIPRYDGDTNPSVWLEDYQLTCHAWGAIDDLFVIKNLPLYLSDSARTWLERLLQYKINDWTDVDSAKPCSSSSQAYG
jgi:hypothetical protein